jgi:hypothetical protein
LLELSPLLAESERGGWFPVCGELEAGGDAGFSCDNATKDIPSPAVTTAIAKRRFMQRFYLA